MFHKITIENFFSIADRQELVLPVSAKTPELSCFRAAVSSAEVRLPTVVGLFGPNASGKSTILRAITSAIMFACWSFSWADQINIFFQSYRQKDWWEKPTKIMFEFDAQLSKEAPFVPFRYELHIAHVEKRFADKVVTYEALSYAPEGRFRRLFERKYQEFYFSPDFELSSTTDRKESIRPNASVISTLAQLNHPLSAFFQRQIGAGYTNTISVHKIQSNTSEWLNTYSTDKACLDRLNQELRRFDVGFEEMFIEQGPQGLFAKFKHVGLDDFILLPEESTGTQRFIEIFPRLYMVLENGGSAIIDEIDTDFHPLLIPELFRWFYDPTRNPHRAQLLFTAHNPALLDFLEKEQVFFTEKPSGQATQVYGLREIKGLRREPSLMKKYLQGELGGVPYIG